MRSSTLLSSLALGFGSLITAQTCNHKAVGSTPAGNPTIAPAVGQQVTPGKPFKITWTNTTAGDVSIVLLKGPSTNAVPFRCIVNTIPNSGEFTWTAPSDLPEQKTGYGLQIVVDKTGQFQYSPQFGISGGQPTKPKSESTSSTSASSSSKHEHTATSLHVNVKAGPHTSSTNTTSVVGSTTIHITGTAPHHAGSTGSISVVQRNTTLSLSNHRSTKTQHVVQTQTATATTGSAANATTTQAIQSQTSNVAMPANAIATQAGIALAGLWGLAAIAL